VYTFTMTVTDLNDILPNDKCVALFWATWHIDCSPGGVTDNIFRALSTTSDEISFYRVEAENYPDLCDKYNISVVPTFIFSDNGEETDRMEGGDDAAQLTQKVLALRNLSHSAIVPSKTSGLGKSDVGTLPLSEEEKLHEKLRSLINASHVVLFMKGSPSNPRCGFSRKAVDLLTSASVPFGSFDILSDEDVRQGLKTFSDWPTYPQFYAGGELVGGLDIVTEMGADGDLAGQLGVDEPCTTEASELNNTPEGDPLTVKIKKLLGRHKIMLFMKGIPSAPKCGFSRQICDILEGLGNEVSYDAFNILEDDEIRQGLKKFSDWPTYPQLYIDGELVGGLDIIKEMNESGDLKDMLD